MKIIRRAWLPTSLPELAIWFMNFAMKFAEFGPGLGFSGTEIDAVAEWNDTVQWIADSQETSDANAEGFRKFRENTLFGEKGDPVPVMPSTALPPPPPRVAVLIIEKLVKLVDRIELADSYSTELGVQLGIIPSKPAPIAPEEWSTTLTLKRVLPDMELEIDFVRGEADGIRLEYQYVGEETWNNGGNYPKRPAILRIPPKTPNAPVAVRIRGRLLKGNSVVGQYSATLNATAAP